MAAMAIVAAAWAQAQKPQPQVKHETVAQLLVDVQALAVINLMDMTVEQMAALWRIAGEYQTLVNAPPAEVVSGLEKVKANLIAGEGERDAWDDANTAKPVSDYDAQLAAARDKAVADTLAFLNNDQKDVLAVRGTPYEPLRRLVWEVGHMRDLDQSQVQTWGDNVVAQLSQPGPNGAPPLMSIDQARDLLTRARGMDDRRWALTAMQLRAQFARSLPTAVRRVLEDPKNIRARISRQLITMLNNPRLADMLDAAVRADQAKQQQPAGAPAAAPAGGQGEEMPEGAQ
jgi:hypothetical protein